MKLRASQIAAMNLDECLDFMQKHGSSVLLNWGEDDNLWECSWITGGDRFTGFADNKAGAARLTIFKVMEAMSERVA